MGDQTIGIYDDIWGIYNESHGINSWNITHEDALVAISLPMFEGCLEIKLPIHGQMQQQSWEESEKREQVEGRSSARKGKKVAEG